MRNTLILTAFIAFGLTLSSCSKDEDFNTGWQASLNSDISLGIDNVGDISLGIIDLEETAKAYLDENEDDYKTFDIVEVTPTSGVMTTTNVVPLDFLDELDIYAVADGTETLIGMANTPNPGDASRGIDFLDINLEDLADDDNRVEIVLKPTYESGASEMDVDTEISLTFDFQVDGVK